MSLSERHDNANQYVICRTTQSNQYSLYRFDPDSTDLFAQVTSATELEFANDWGLTQIGAYLLQWSPVCQQNKEDGYQFKLIQFDPQTSDPLNAPALQTGFWPKNKFWDYRQYYSTNKNEDKHLALTSMGSFVLNTILTEGRGTFRLFNFDAFPSQPGNQDPLTSYFGLGQGSFAKIRVGHNLLPIGNYVIDRHPDGEHYSLWSFDPQLQVPLSLPAIQKGRWSHIDARHQLLVLGDLILDWLPESGDYRLWEFDPEAQDLLIGPLKQGKLCGAFSANSILTSFKARSSGATEQANIPGTLDFMRSKIKHVVYYMVESRSFDNVVGWLYENDKSRCHYLGSDRPFDGASTDDYNVFEGQQVHVSQFQQGKLSVDWDLMALDQDPFHNTMDSLSQMYSNIDDYWQAKSPDMHGFVKNNANPQVMQTFSPTQLPVLNGLAENFAVSDEWFSSMPGGTDVNRGFSVTGSAYDKLGTWEGGDAYKYFPDSPHRQSLWKVLWSQGISDWKIYYSMEWKGAIFTNQLYLKGQIPTVDANPDDYLAGMDQFMTDAQNGTLPAFSYLEPFWYKPNGTTSYHPGCDLVPAERALNAIYNAISEGPGWEQTLLVVTFDKNNGTYDHVKPPFAKKPWPNDKNNGFAYDLMGPRVPAVFVSPWIDKNTVIRSGQETPFDSTSFAATLLKWFGIPKAQWALGDRLQNAPTFEHVFQQQSARTDRPAFTPPYDKSFPPK